ncbi:BREX system serine/threonine kinase PglW [Streptantibioticus rubrisoli]|uniref:BREX system serine/threonine kinase PglW n=1 Tax=Streptantibioticus rubrisoli TaxID=1387313 RepID=A0ABT1PFK5_9ACTN|nr:BREX system serine/threonine kinase PglW [Streptantibioticus rubrisoli]MCQ4043248.1 BREX system serine/threonine kinase PglW [Streptantibioticus rubrisoli]
MRDGRWETVTDSEFPHERRGLEAIRDKLPDAEPWRAWSNFTFTASTGHVREVDLLVVAPGGVYLIELKDWHGSVESRNGSWLQTRPGGQQLSHSNPLHLANKKARELGDLLRQATPHGMPAPWVSEAVCFTDSSLRIRLPAHDQQGVYTINELVAMLKEPPREQRRRFDATRSRALKSSLERIGIARSDAAYKVGPYLLNRKAFDSGPTWADYLAQHSELPEAARIRVYLRERGSDAELRASVERAARREAAVLRRFRHPGVVQLKQYDPSGHTAGPALIFEYDPRTLRLDEYLAQYGDKLDILGRMALVRQLAETVRSAHGARIYHRTLSAHSVHVIPRPRGRAAGTDTETAGWLVPHLQISDWQVAVQRLGDHGQATADRFAPTALSNAGAHIAEGADPYLAPDLTALNPDPVALDIYGLGMLTYLLATGKPPGASQAELVARLEAGEGLRPSALVDGLSPDIDELVQAATAFRPGQRLATVNEFLEMLEFVEESLTAPPGEGPAPAVEAAARAATGAPAPSIPDQPRPAAEEQQEKDPLDAVPGDVLAGRWEVRRRLGTGSTSRAFLVRDLTVDPSVRGRSKAFAVLKVAMSEERAKLLVREAEVMGRLRPDSRIIRLVEPEPQKIAGRTVLVIEYVGDEREEDTTGSGTVSSRRRRREETVARLLRDEGRLTVDQLESYGDYLFGAVDFLEGEGVWHRDIKPDNIAIRVRPNRTRELVLIDFSLAGYPVQEYQAGTEGYLDPFLGTLARPVYDGHAERYALAVTLHEMASRELPVWGDGKVSARQTDEKDQPYPTIAADAFDSAVKDALVKFFRTALHRDASKRYPELKQMRDAWKKIFLDLDEALPSSHRPSRSRHSTPTPATPTANSGDADAPTTPGIEAAEPESAEQQRNLWAEQATRETPINSSGLGPAAISFVHGLGVHTVGQLLDLSQRRLLNAPGLGTKTRNEVQGRIKQWRKKFAEQPPSPLTPEGRKEARAELSAAEAALNDAVARSGGDQAGGLGERALRAVSLDTLAAIFVPELRKNGANANEVEMVRLLLRLPDEHGELPAIGAWPKQKDVADVLGLTAGRIPQMLKAQRTRWKRNTAVRALRGEVLELLRGMGRVAAAAEIADALTVRRGTQLQTREQRRALALAAVRVVVEVEQLDPASREFQHAANRDAVDEGMGAGLLALEVGDDDGPDTPSGPALLEYAQRLGRVADKLAEAESLPTSATVLAELGAVPPPPGAVAWDERRIVQLAAAASRNAAATPRLEIYPRNLPLVRALRLTQAGLVRLVPGVPEGQQAGLRVEEIHERVRARFPELLDARGGHSLPEGGRLTKALQEAGFDLVLKTHEDNRIQRYLPRHANSISSYISSDARGRTLTAVQATRYDNDPTLAAAIRTGERLLASARRDGFRVLTVHTLRMTGAVRRLSTPDGQVGAEVLSVAELFIAALHEQVDRRPKPTWETILKADVAEPGSKAAMKFAEYARTAWSLVEPRIAARLGRANGDGPVLLVDAGVLARYDAMATLERLADRARHGERALWLLCPQSDPARPPRLGRTAVAYQSGLGEWIELPDAWVVRPGTAAVPSAADAARTPTAQQTSVQQRRA